MKCEKVRLREDTLLECPLCEEEVVQCDDCKDSSTIDEDSYCYNDGDMHFCKKCWEETLKKR